MPIKSKFGHWTRSIEAKTANYTLTAADNGKIFTNRGAAGAVTFTLPAPSTALEGVEYTFMAVVAAQNLIVAGAGANDIVAFNNAAAASVAFQTAAEIIGGAVTMVCDGTSWLAFVSLGAETQTPTIGA